MARTQQDWFEIYEYNWRLALDRLERLLKFDQNMRALPDGIYTESGQAIVAAEIASSKDAVEYLEKCLHKEAEGQQVLDKSCGVLIRLESFSGEG